MINLLPKRSIIYKLYAEDFTDLSPVFPEKELIEKTIDRYQVNVLTGSGGFMFLLGIHFSSYLKLKAKEFDDRYVSYCLNNQTDSVNSALGNLKKSFPVIWLGVTGQKRELIEQVDAYVAVIEKVKESFPDLTIVFDGWTSPLHINENDKIQINADREITKQIMEKLTFSVPVVDVIGMTSKDKVSIASKCHFFISNHGTGSLHVSRFLQKTGLTHLSNSFSKSHGDESIHYNAHKYPSELVVDDPGVNKPGVDRPDMLSYHVDPEKFSNYFIDLFVDNKPPVQHKKLFTGKKYSKFKRNPYSFFADSNMTLSWMRFFCKRL